jgi:hypothetical protein
VLRQIVVSAASERAANEELRKWLENLNDEDLGLPQDVAFASSPRLPTSAVKRVMKFK